MTTYNRQGQLMPTRVYVRNIPKAVTPEEFHEYFKSYARVVTVNIINSQGSAQNYGFLHFETPQEATALINSTSSREYIMQNSTLHLLPAYLRSNAAFRQPNPYRPDFHEQQYCTPPAAPHQMPHNYAQQPNYQSGPYQINYRPAPHSGPVHFPASGAYGHNQSNYYMPPRQHHSPPPPVHHHHPSRQYAQVPQYHESFSEQGPMPGAMAPVVYQNLPQGAQIPQDFLPASGFREQNIQTNAPPHSGVAAFRPGFSENFNNSQENANTEKDNSS